MGLVCFDDLEVGDVGSTEEVQVLVDRLAEVASPADTEVGEIHRQCFAAYGRLVVARVVDSM